MNGPYRVSVLIDADGKIAKAELRAVGAEAQKTAKSTEKLGPAGKTAATGMAAAGKASISMANSGRMATQQLSQVVQQSVATGNVMQALAIQAADIGLAFGTIGAVAGIAASIALPALMAAFGGSEDKARALQSAIDGLGSSVQDLRSIASSLAEDDLEGLRKKYGEVTEEVLGLIAAQGKLADMNARASLKTALAGLAEMNDRGAIAGAFDGLRGGVTEDVRALAGRLDIALGQAQAVASALRQLETARSVQSQADAAGALREALVQVIAVVGDGNQKLNDMLGLVIDVEDNARQLLAASKDAREAFDGAEDAVWDIEEALNSVIAGVNGAVTSAEALELAFLNAAGAASSIALPAPPDVTVTPLGDPPATIGGYTEQEFARGYSALSYYSNRPTPTPPRQRAGGGAGGGGAAAEADAVQELIKSLEEEVALARETDPVQKELLRNREALAGATDEERAAVEELIRTRMEEERAAAAAAEASDFFAQTAYDALEGLILQGDSLSDVFDNLAMTIAQAALQAALLGTGPLAGIFGMGESGGALGMIFGSLFGQAEGGMVYGPGTGTSDSVPRRLSNGEFVVNAAATQRNRHALEAINSGHDVPGLASGGYVGPPANLAAAPAGSAVPINITVENRSSAQVEGQVEEFTSPSGQRSMRLVLADQVGAAMTQPGGGAKKVLGNRYGIRQRGTRR